MKPESLLLVLALMLVALFSARERRLPEALVADGMPRTQGLQFQLLAGRGWPAGSIKLSELALALPVQAMQRIASGDTRID